MRNIVEIGKVAGAIGDVGILGSAVLGAATRKSILGSNVWDYRSRMEKEPASFYNPEEEVIKQEFDSRIIGAASKRKYSLDDLLTNPWNYQEIKILRLTASLIAFSNDHGKKTVPEFFPVDKISDFLNAVRESSLITGKQLTVVDQFDIALKQTDNNPVAAALLEHASYRAIARSCDTRLSPKLSFKVESETQPITTMNIARSTADFSMSNVRDPLGNTYHWWAQFSAGMIFTLLKKRHPIQTRICNAAFYLGPNLTVILRNKIQHIPLSSGDHKSVDRQGLRLGKAMGNLISNILLNNV